jgi:Family of unknown function (DUF6600)/FecR protein
MKKFLVSLAGLLLMAGMSVARAQDSAPPPPDDTQQAPPPEENIYDNTGAQQQQINNSEDQQQGAAQPGVARVSYAHGDVSTQRGDNGQWVAVTLNTPVSVDDRVSTGDRSSAELQLDYANVLRMSERATARVAALTRTQIQVQVGQGLVTYNVLKGSEASSEIDTPNAAIRTAPGEGEYRILVNNDQQTQIIVRKGSVDISTPQGSTRVESGQMVTIAGTPDSAQYQVTNAPNRDDWDRWNNDRNKTITSAQSWQKTNRYYTGSEDLDAYGRWTTVPDYGQVWVPSVDPGWAPYRAGRWVWQPYYGWTWVSYEPWGWAPYHYGRWFVWGGNWVWWPGPVVAYPAYYPVWSPAYVSFFGFGGGGWGFGIGIGFGFGWGWGHVGWLPVGPCDWYHPWYGHWGGRVNVVNVNNIHNTTFVHNGFAPLTRGGAHPMSNVNQMMTNDHVRSGFSSMASNEFGRGSVPLHQSSISASELRGASMSTGKMPFTPTKASYSPTDRAANPSSYSHAPSNSQRFVTSTNAHNSLSASNNPSHSPSAFNGGARTFSNSQAHSAGPAVNSSRSGASTNAPANPQSGWHSLGSGNANSNSTHGSNPPQNSSASKSNTSMGGWHTFTPPQHSASGPASNGHSSQPPAQNNTTPRTFNSPAPQHGPTAPQSGQGGWRTFTPPSHQSQPKTNYRGGYSTTANRPPLNMNKPIVTPRSNSGYSAPGGGNPSPAYHSAPSGGGGHSYSSAPHNSGGSSSHSGTSSHSNGGRR